LQFIGLFTPEGHIAPNGHIVPSGHISREAHIARRQAKSAFLGVCEMPFGHDMPCRRDVPFGRDMPFGRDGLRPTNPNLKIPYEKRLPPKWR
jgi:hypothetical protein